MKTISHAFNTIPANPGFFVVESVSGSARLYPAIRLSKVPVLAWVIETHIYDTSDFDDSPNEVTEVNVVPVTYEGTAYQADYVLQDPFGVFTTRELTMDDEIDVLNYFNEVLRPKDDSAEVGGLNMSLSAFCRLHGHETHLRQAFKEKREAGNDG